jgi:tRNA 2-thiouridine synthesizing protein A
MVQRQDLQEIHGRLNSRKKEKFKGGHMSTATGKTDAQDIPVTERIDVKGLVCPRPMVMTMNTLKGLNAGEVLEVIANDSSVKHSIPSLCERGGYKLLSQRDEDGKFIFLIQK